MDAVTNAVGLALGGSPTAGVIAGVASPYINTAIKQATEGNEQANLIAHALWGAVEAYTQGGKAGAGAAAAVTGEVGAKLISEQVFGKSPENLTEAEKRTVSELSQVAAGLASGLASGSGSSLSTAQAVKTGQGVGKNAVENNAVNQKQAGTVEGFELTLNSTKRKVGLAKGDEAEKYLLEFSEIENFKPAKTGFSNKIDDRYVYTEVGGWIDMTHFLFYAGQAYKNKLESKGDISRYIGFIPQSGMIEEAISKKASSEAMTLGYLQELSDTIFAPHSKFSYDS